ncbi:hypothetical protein Pla163_10550 [Planctomycetes bacterium Pla163]|uniref:Uncharacterized protein n=1 Tax=Rohdeia mirabilis TaxID=2528008 RepID=A0A518CXL0_9BACT|nr:hypothetical protein Pla163_10550 [Planctomycetes bacterium Pla163]
MSTPSSPSPAAPTPADTRAALAELDERHQKMVTGLFSVMVGSPQQVHDREWMAEQLIQVTLLAGGHDIESPDQGPEVVQAIETELRAFAPALLRAAMLLFQRVGLDLAARAKEGFSFEDALAQALSYLPRTGEADDTPRHGV